MNRLLATFLAPALLLALLPASGARAAEADSSLGAERRIYVGVGAGFEAGNGIRLGYSIGRHGVETGVGVVYLGETGTLRYSYGLRYLFTLYEGAYAWTGAGAMGHREGSDRASTRSAGAGIGVSWKLGSMFYLMLDSGWRMYSDSEVEDGEIQINPTFNGALVYKW